MRGAREEAPPESDRFEPAPHPRDTSALFGHRKAEAELLQAYQANRLPQAFILGGPVGIGKATLAWRLARFLAAHPDPASPEVLHAHDLGVDPAHPVARKISSMAFGDLALLRRGWNEKTKKFFTRIAVEDVRKMLRLFEQAAAGGGWRMAIVDFADDLNASGANALLKMIEEPPPRSLFLLVAHQPGRLLPTIHSRCRRVMLQPLGDDDLRAATRAACAAADLRRTPRGWRPPAKKPRARRAKRCACCRPPTPGSTRRSRAPSPCCRVSTGRWSTPSPTARPATRPPSTPCSPPPSAGSARS